MSFAIVCIGMIVAIGIVAAIASRFDKGDDAITTGHDCSTCTAEVKADCKLHCMMEEAKAKKEKEKVNA